MFWLCIRFLLFLKLLEKHRVLARSRLLYMLLILKPTSGFPFLVETKLMTIFNRNRSWNKVPVPAPVCVSWGD